MRKSFHSTLANEYELILQYAYHIALEHAYIEDELEQYDKIVALAGRKGYAVFTEYEYLVGTKAATIEYSRNPDISNAYGVTVIKPINK